MKKMISTNDLIFYSFSLNFLLVKVSQNQTTSCYSLSLLYILRIVGNLRLLSYYVFDYLFTKIFHKKQQKLDHFSSIEYPFILLANSVNFEIVLLYKSNSNLSKIKFISNESFQQPSQEQKKENLSKSCPNQQAPLMLYL